MPKPLQPKALANSQDRSRRKFLNMAGGTAIATAAGLALTDSTTAATQGNEVSSTATGDSKKKPDFKQYVTERLEELTAITALDGPIYSELTKVRAALNALSSRLEGCSNAVGDPNQIKAINETLCEIKRALGIPCP